MKQKTIELIKIWSVVVGVLSLSSLLTLSVYPVSSLVGIVSVIAILLGLAVLYAGLKVASMDLKTVGMIFWAKFVWLVLNFILSLLHAPISGIRLLIIIVQAGIVWFLLMNLKKLYSGSSSSADAPASK